MNTPFFHVALSIFVLIFILMLKSYRNTDTLLYMFIYRSVLCLKKKTCGHTDKIPIITILNLGACRGAQLSQFCLSGGPQCQTLKAPVTEIDWAMSTICLTYWYDRQIQMTLKFIITRLNFFLSNYYWVSSEIKLPCKSRFIFTYKWVLFY